MPRRKRHLQTDEDIITELQSVLPENAEVSECEFSSSEEDDIEIDYDDTDPDYVPKLPRGMVTAEEHDSEEEIDDLPDHSVPKKSKRKNSTINHVWKVDDISPVQLQPDAFSDVYEVCTPYQYFMQFFTEDLIQLIVYQTNLYAVQVEQTSIKTTVNEMKDFLSILIIMGMIELPSYTDYWESGTRIPQVADVMPLKRFQKLRRFIHFNDNSQAENSNDRFFKVRPLLEHIRKKFLEIEQENCFSVDETMVPYKGTRAGNLRQYIKNKPHKWGFKFFVRAGVSGIVYDFFPYQGKPTFEVEENLPEDVKEMGFGAKAVILLLKHIPHMETPIVVYYDNYFSSIGLMTYLKTEMNVMSLGTIRANRLEGCPLETDKILQKKGRGSFDFRSNEDGVIIVKWVDNKCVTIGSTSNGIEPQTSVKRYDKTVKNKTNIKCPNLINQYNIHMGGVDLSNMCVSLYRIPSKARRWYFPIFTYMLNLCIVNAWLLQKRHCKEIKQKKLTLKRFRAQISEALRASGRVKKKRPSIEEIGEEQQLIRRPVTQRPVDDIRFDGIDHWPLHSKRGRCKLCRNGTSRVVCSKCNIALCFSDKKNCFFRFHKKG